MSHALPHQEATHCRALGELGQPGECTVGVRNAGCLPHNGGWILHSWRWEWGEGQHQKTKRCEVTGIYIILRASSLLKSPDKPVDTCFMVPRAAEVLFTVRNIFQPLSFILLSWFMLQITMGLQIQCKKKSILCDPLTLVHQNDRWL